MSVNPMTWMTDSFSVIGNRPLQEISMPGSHDCGMSRLNNSTSLSDACNTQTQTVDIAGQLTLAGARYFDVRPILWDALIGANDASSNNVLSLYTGHFSTIPVMGWEGSAGQSLEDILSEAASFIQQPGCEKEVVILKFSHYLYLSGINVGASPFTNDQFTQLITQVKARLQNQLFTSQTSDLNLNAVTLATVVAGSGRIVAVFDALPDGFADPASGIFAYADYASPPATANLTVFETVTRIRKASASCRRISSANSRFGTQARALSSS